jgi:hypothetical protein
LTGVGTTLTADHAKTFVWWNRMSRWRFRNFLLNLFFWAFCLATRFELMLVGAISVVIR